MTFPLQMTVRGAENSPALEAAVLKRAAKMETFSQAITGCRITFEMNEASPTGKHECRVMLALSVPGNCLVVHQRNNSGAYGAINQVFLQAERALRKHEQRQRAAHRPMGLRAFPIPTQPAWGVPN